MSLKPCEDLSDIFLQFHILKNNVGRRDFSFWFSYSSYSRLMSHPPSNPHSPCRLWGGCFLVMPFSIFMNYFSQQRRSEVLQTQCLIPAGAAPAVKYQLYLPDQQDKYEQNKLCIVWAISLDNSILPKNFSSKQLWWISFSYHQLLNILCQNWKSSQKPS